jgi:2,4-dienoyl-CoA reductase-like NADH-dependent reductase (Old Yellow Enzyme family)
MGTSVSGLSRRFSNKANLSLFTNVKIGSYEFPNRVVMAAMTRCRADPSTGIATDLHADYYSQRAEGSAFVLTECSGVSKIGNCFPGAAGIYTEEQAQGWSKVTERVHKVDGKIFLQIWHGGRAGRKEVIGQDPVAPSSLPIRTKQGDKIIEGDVPKELTVDQIKEIVEEFRRSAKLAKKAGFDGLEVHGANGYLVDQFLRDATNKRKDKYGGSIENRCRFPLEVIDALISVYGADKVGIKLSPVARYQDMYDSDPIPLYTYLLQELQKKKIAFVEIVEASDEESLYEKSPTQQIPNVLKTFRPHFKNIIIGNNSFDLNKANEAISNGFCDVVSFGRLFISNPDLVERFKNNSELAQVDWSTAYGGSEKGYTSYPKNLI